MYLLADTVKVGSCLLATLLREAERHLVGQLARALLVVEQEGLVQDLRVLVRWLGLAGKLLANLHHNKRCLQPSPACPVIHFTQHCVALFSDALAGCRWLQVRQ